MLPSSASQLDRPCSLHILSLSLSITASVLLLREQEAFTRVQQWQLFCCTGEAHFTHAGLPGFGHGVKEPCTWCSPSKWLVNATSHPHHLTGIPHAALPSAAALGPVRLSSGLLFPTASVTHHAPSSSQSKPHTSLCPPVPGFLRPPLFPSHLTIFIIFFLFHFRHELH